MPLYTTLFASLLSVLPTITASPLSYNRAACQKPTKDPLHGCPPNTLLVGPNQTYCKIQDAVLSLPDNDDAYTILIQPGIYFEQVNVTRHAPLTLLGVTSHPNDREQNTVTLLWRNATGTPSTGSYDNAFTSALTIAPTLNASLTGSGPTGDPVPPGTPFGNIDFRVYNLDITNDYLPYSAGPALALSMSYANAGFYHTRFASYQDTIYVGKLGNAYMHSSTIAGQTDFLYGFGTLWITRSELAMRSCGGGITAWKGTNTTFENKYGVYVVDSAVRKANASLAIEGECALGRPWNAQHRSIFAHCYLDDSIRPSGYIQWGSTDPRINFSKCSLVCSMGDRGCSC